MYKQRQAEIKPIDHSFGASNGNQKAGNLMALIALSHTPIEHDLYQVMLAETNRARTRLGAFSARRLMELTRINSYSTIRRGIVGLVAKLSIERHKVIGDGKSRQFGTVYLVFTPEEIITRRRAAGLPPYPREVEAYQNNSAFNHAITRVVERYDLSRRESQVALCCAEGLTNAEIGEKLFISEQTAKCHLRHVFVKFGVKRRTELISRLLTFGGSE